VELAGSLVALVDCLETRAGSESAVVSSFKPTRSPSLTECPRTGLSLDASFPRQGQELNGSPKVGARNSVTTFRNPSLSSAGKTS
jgi:hypothetical protein